MISKILSHLDLYTIGIIIIVLLIVFHYKYDLEFPDLFSFLRMRKILNSLFSGSDKAVKLLDLHIADDEQSVFDEIYNEFYVKTTSKFLDSAPRLESIFQKWKASKISSEYKKITQYDPKERYYLACFMLSFLENGMNTYGSNKYMDFDHKLNEKGIVSAKIYMSTLRILSTAYPDRNDLKDGLNRCESAFNHGKWYK